MLNRRVPKLPKLPKLVHLPVEVRLPRVPPPELQARGRSQWTLMPTLLQNAGDKLSLLGPSSLPRTTRRLPKLSPWHVLRKRYNL
ncbi:unnamed protein product [Prunus armeniaca]